MTRKEVLCSTVLKRKFCKDCHLPISVFEEPYFSQRLNALNPMFGCVEKFRVFCASLKSFANEQEYFAHYNEIKDNIINHIKENSAYIDFLEYAASDAINKKIEEFKTIASKKDLYTEINNGGLFVSIDMIQANFTALHIYNGDIFDGAECWEEFISRFTDNAHIINSKYIRQVIFGACNPKWQIRYEKYLMGILLDHLIKTIPNINVYSYGDDENILSVRPGCGFSMKALREAVKSCPHNIGKCVRVDLFELTKIAGTDGWMKSYYDAQPGSYIAEPRAEFKCLDADIYHQIVKHYYCKEITEDDLVIYHNGMLARFLREVDDPWN